MDVDAAKALALRINMEVEVRKGPPYLPAAETPFKDAETISSSTSKCSLLTTSRTGPSKCTFVEICRALRRKRSVFIPATAVSF